MAVVVSELAGFTSGSGAGSHVTANRASVGFGRYTPHYGDNASHCYFKGRVWVLDEFYFLSRESVDNLLSLIRGAHIEQSWNRPEKPKKKRST